MEEEEWLSIQVDQQEVDRVKLETDASRDFDGDRVALKTEKESTQSTVYGNMIQPMQQDLLEEGRLKLKLWNQTTIWRKFVFPNNVYIPYDVRPLLCMYAEFKQTYLGDN